MVRGSRRCSRWRGALARFTAAGWTPKATIRIAGWDAEEIGELGSTAYVTAHRDELARGCIAYLNTDESASGPKFGASAAAAIAPALTAAVGDVLHVANARVDDPRGRLRLRTVHLQGRNAGDRHRLWRSVSARIIRPTMTSRFTELFADPGFVHHRAIAQAIGAFAMRLAASGTGGVSFRPLRACARQGRRSVTHAAGSAHLTVGAALGTTVTRFGRSADCLRRRTSRARRHTRAAGRAAARRARLFGQRLRERGVSADRGRDRYRKAAER